MQTIFFHIPKAGGSTLHSVLERMYSPEETFTIDYSSNNWILASNNFKNIPQERINRIKLLKGHMFFGLHKYFQNNDVKYFTFLRNPVERIISHYNFVLRSTEHYLHEIVVKEKMSLESYALSDISWELDNGMTRLISGVQSTPLNSCTEDLFDKAINNLKSHFKVIGFTEKYNESLILLKNELNWETYPYYRQLNQTKREQSVSEEIKKKITERNVYDVKLYQWAMDLFNDEVKIIQNFNQEVEILRETNIAFNTGYNKGEIEGHKKGLIIGAAQRNEVLFNRYPLLKLLRKIKKNF